MKRRILFLTAILLSLCFSAAARQESGWFAGAGLGLNIGIDGNKYDGRATSHVGAGFAADIYAGYNFNEKFGARLGWQGLSASNHYTEFGATSFNYIHADALWRADTWAVPYVHAGFLHVNKGGLGAGAGIMLPIRVGSQICLIPDFRATASSGSVYGFDGGLSVSLSATLGVVWEFGRK